MSCHDHPASSGRGYRRAILKISGQALSGERGFGLDPQRIQWVAREIHEAQAGSRQLGVVVGGGNIIRGVDSAAMGVPLLVGDRMGMIATVLNAMALRYALEAIGLTAAVLGSFQVGCFVQQFEMEQANRILEDGHVLVFAGGTGNPCFTTDSAAALRAVELDAEVMVKATQVRGVYDKDPLKHPDAVMFETISPDEMLARRLGVIDATCIEVLARKRIPSIVLDLHQEGNLARALAGDPVGTKVA